MGTRKRRIQIDQLLDVLNREDETVMTSMNNFLLFSAISRLLL
jgi:hypothetical protein